MKLREALTQQSPSLALQRAAADEIARLDALVVALSTELAGIKNRRMTAVQVSPTELDHALAVGATPEQLEAMRQLTLPDPELMKAGLTD